MIRRFLHRLILSCLRWNLHRRYRLWMRSQDRFLKNLDWRPSKTQPLLQFPASPPQPQTGAQLIAQLDPTYLHWPRPNPHRTRQHRRWAQFQAGPGIPPSASPQPTPPTAAPSASLGALQDFLSPVSPAAAKMAAIRMTRFIES